MAGKVVFKKAILAEFPDISLRAANLYDIYKNYGTAEGLDYTSPGGSRIVVLGSVTEQSLRNTNIFLGGKNNLVEIDGLRAIVRLDLACIKNGRISIKTPQVVRGMTVVASDGGSVEIGADCMVSRDVMVYASKAHGLYNVTDGSRRSRHEIKIGDHVWLGQGVRVLAGASIGDGAVIGSYSVLAARVPNNCTAAGNPCEVRTKNVFWTSRAAPDSGNYFEHLDKAGLPVPDFVKMTDEQS